LESKEKLVHEILNNIDVKPKVMKMGFAHPVFEKLLYPLSHTMVEVTCCKPAPDPDLTEGIGATKSIPKSIPAKCICGGSCTECGVEQNL
jgi:hypothetical protein